jgi:hypothetical protein
MIRGMSEASNYLPTPKPPREYLENPYADPTLIMPQEPEKKAEVKVEEKSKPEVEKAKAKQDKEENDKETYHRDYTSDEKQPNRDYFFCFWRKKTIKEEIVQVEPVQKVGKTKYSHIFKLYKFILIKIFNLN